MNKLMLEYWGDKCTYMFSCVFIIYHFLNTPFYFPAKLFIMIYYDRYEIWKSMSFWFFSNFRLDSYFPFWDEIWFFSIDITIQHGWQVLILLSWGMMQKNWNIFNISSKIKRKAPTPFPLRVIVLRCFSIFSCDVKNFWLVRVRHLPRMQPENAVLHPIPI